MDAEYGTNQWAINTLEGLIDDDDYFYDEDIDAIKMGIEALKEKPVYVVTYWNGNEEPIVTVWNNKINADKHYEYCKTTQENAIIDECKVYKKCLTPN